MLRRHYNAAGAILQRSFFIAAAFPGIFCNFPRGYAGKIDIRGRFV